MSNDEAPKPGEPGYEQYMAARYRAQRDGVMDAPLTDGGNASSYRHSLDENGVVRVSVHRGSTLGPEHQPTHYTAEQGDPQQVVALEREAERIRAELAEVSHYDQRTGEPVLRYMDAQRHAREVRLDYLDRIGIPGVRELQKRAAAWRADNVPSTLQILTDERDRRDRLAARAREIADEREAEALAERVQAERRSKGQ